jgi:hypothetical protein
MAAITAVLPRMSKGVQEQLVTRVPVRWMHRPSAHARTHHTERRVQRVIVLTAAALTLAGAATAVAFWLSRRYAAYA